MEKKFYNVTEVANILCLSKSHIYSEVSKNKIPSIKIGKRILIPATYITKITEIAHVAI